MKKTILVIGLIAIMLSVGLIGGCYRGSEANGKVTTKTFDYKDFTAIEVENNFDLEITYAETFSITVSGSDRSMDHLEVSKSGDVLKVGKKGWGWSWFWESTPKAVITLPDLHRLDVSGASWGEVRGFKSGNNFALRLSGASTINLDMETGDFEARVSGASDLDINMKAGTLDTEISGASKLTGNIDTGNSRIELSGASDVRLTGSGSDLRLECSGASGAKLIGYPVTNADVNLSGASDADIDVSGNLDVTVSGASTLNYYGSPDLGRTDITGASDLNHKTR